MTSFGRGTALLVGLTFGALLVGGIAVADPIGVLPAGWQTALGSTSDRTATPTTATPEATAQRLRPDLPTLALPPTASQPTPSAPSAAASAAAPPTAAPPTAAPTTAAPTTAAPTTTAPVRAAERTPTPPPPATASRPTDGAAATVAALTNDARADAGCEPLRTDPRLTTAAQAHSTDMAENGYFDHYSQDGRDPVDRMRAAGYSAPGGENIARGQRDAVEVVRDWLNSPGHRRNIEDCSFITIGVGLDDRGHYWTQDFGR